MHALPYSNTTEQPHHQLHAHTRTHSSSGNDDCTRENSISDSCVCMLTSVCSTTLCRTGNLYCILFCVHKNIYGPSACGHVRLQCNKCILAPVHLRSHVYYIVLGLLVCVVLCVQKCSMTIHMCV